jgi:hypothetical protein
MVRNVSYGAKGHGPGTTRVRVDHETSVYHSVLSTQYSVLRVRPDGKFR